MKKIISLVLCMSLAISSVVFTTASAEETVKHDRNIALLNKLGITTASEQRANEKIARDEFASFIVNYATGASFTADEDAESVFTDVKKNNKFASYINAVAEMGYMEGPGDGIFEPSGAVTLTHVKYVVIRALGYDTSKLTEVNIQQIVDMNELMKDVYIKDAASLTVAEVSAILVNALSATPYMDDYDFGNRTILDLKFGMFYTDGMFMSGNTEGFNNCIYIDGVKYDTEVLPEYDDLNGAMVRAYIRKSTNEVEFLDTQYFKNDYYNIEASDVISATTDQIRFYNENGKEDRETITGCVVVYNGRRTTLSPSDLVYTNGEITLVGRNGEWKAILINRYDTIVVGAIVGNTVYDYYDSTFNHTFPADAVFVYGNNIITVEEIANGDVLSVAYSKDSKKCTVYVSREEVVGEVKIVNNDYIQVGRQNIYRSDYFVSNVAEPKPGTVITLLLDHKGRAVAIADTNVESVKYAYVMKPIPGDGFEQAMLRIFTSDGEFKALNLATKVLLNGTRLPSEQLGQAGTFTEAFKTKVGLAADGTKTYTVMNDYVRQVIGYKVNSVGEIVYIDTAIDGVGESDNCLDLEAVIDNVAYQAAISQFAGTYGFAKDSVVFFVPDSKGNKFDGTGNLDTAERSSIDNEQFATGRSLMINDNPYDAYIYNVTDGGFGKVAVVDSPAGASGARAALRYGTGFLAVMDVYTAVNKNDEVSYEVVGYDRDGKKKTYIVADPDNFVKDVADPTSVPKKGDLLTIELDYKGEIGAIGTILDIDDTTPTTKGYEWVFHTNYYAYSKDENGLIYTGAIGDTSDLKVASFGQVTRFLLIDMEAETAEVTDYTSIKTYKEAMDNASRIGVFGNYSRPQMIVIYR